MNIFCIKRKITKTHIWSTKDKIIKISTISTFLTISVLIFLNDFNKIIISHLCFFFIMYGFGYFYFYTNCIPIMIFSTISFSILMHFTDNSWFDPPTVGLLLNKFGNLTIYYIWNIQASNFSSVPYLKDFGNSQLEFERLRYANISCNLPKNSLYFSPHRCMTLARLFTVISI